MKKQINLAKSAGFCFGVKRAIRIALDTVHSNSEIYMLGDIVHNEDVVKMISRAGIQKIRRLTNGKDKILLIRAHGSDLATINKAIRLGYKIIDATCPMVKEIHKIVTRMENKGYKIIVIGDKKHDEVHGIVGHLKKKAIIIDHIKHIPFKKIKNLKKASVVVQSTQNPDKALAILNILLHRIPEVKFFNTICQPTRIKQEEIKTLPLRNDIVIIIGSKNSANTRRLYEISKSLNKKSYWVNSQKQIKPKWFKGVKNVGVAAGASTPENTIQEIIKFLKEIS